MNEYTPASHQLVDNNYTALCHRVFTQMWDRIPPTTLSNFILSQEEFLPLGAVDATGLAPGVFYTFYAASKPRLVGPLLIRITFLVTPKAAAK